MLGYCEWLDGLERGIAAHHAGLLPTFKEVVEELFARGPGQGRVRHRDARPGHQHARPLASSWSSWSSGTARPTPTSPRGSTPSSPAGRGGAASTSRATPSCSGSRASTRAPSPGSPRPAPTRCARASARPTTWRSTSSARWAASGPARSSRRRSRSSRPTARSWAWPGRCGATRRRWTATREAMTCHLGDFDGVRRAAPARSRTARPSCRAARPAAPAAAAPRSAGGAAHRRRRSGCRPDAAPGCAVVLDPGIAGGADGPRPTVLTADRQVRRLSVGRLPGAGRAAGPRAGPQVASTRAARSRRRDLASTLRTGGAGRPTGGRAGRRARRRGEDASRPAARGELRAHPCHGCADREDHARWARALDQRLQRETEQLDAAASRAGPTRSPATFDRVCDAARRARLPGRATPSPRPASGSPGIYAELGPARRRVPARRASGTGWTPRRARRLRVGARVRVAARDDAGRPAAAARAGSEGAGRDGAGLGPRWRTLERGPPPRVSCASPTSGFAWAALPLGAGARLDAVLADGDLRGRRLRALVQAAGGPARPDRATAGADGRAALRRAAGRGRRRPPRRRRLLLGGREPAGDALLGRGVSAEPARWTSTRQTLDSMPQRSASSTSASGSAGAAGSRVVDVGQRGVARPRARPSVPPPGSRGRAAACAAAPSGPGRRSSSAASSAVQRAVTLISSPAAVFSPTPATPGSPSLGSPRSAAKSAYARRRGRRTWPPAAALSTISRLRMPRAGVEHAHAARRRRPAGTGHGRR